MILVAQLLYITMLPNACSIFGSSGQIDPELRNHCQMPVWFPGPKPSLWWHFIEVGVSGKGVTMVYNQEGKTI